MRLAVAILSSLICLAAPAWATGQARFFTTSDGVRLHYIEAAPRNPAHTIVLVPGWTMPAWIFQKQIDSLSRRYRVLALDPRSQGESAIAPSGHDHVRRGRDIAELIAAARAGQVLLVGWSLGVLDSLAYVRAHGDAALAGLVLIDNSVGEDPPPPPPVRPMKPGPKLPREVMMRNFVRGMFATPQPDPWLNRLTATALRTPEKVAAQLLAYPVPRTWWKEAVYSTARPVFYLVRPKFAGQAANLRARHPSAEAVVLESGVGHALFVDDPAGFERLLGDFIRRRVWP
jgi:microsomal epoxide hydrolase